LLGLVFYFGGDGGVVSFVVQGGEEVAGECFEEFDVFGRQLGAPVAEAGGGGEPGLVGGEGGVGGFFFFVELEKVFGIGEVEV